MRVERKESVVYILTKREEPTESYFNQKKRYNRKPKNKR